MTVQVVDPNPDPSVIKHAIYRKCGCKLSYVPNDVKEYHGTDYSGGPDGEKWIDCAKCGKEVILESW